ncbi:MAG: ADP-forming succinate--CoA ligase subunit beta [Candidatus Glassbacteria bacterium]
MKLHEYQAKEIFKDFGIPVPRGEVAKSPEDAYRIASEIGKEVVIKAQVHVGGRGKAGGVKLAENADDAKKAATAILGMDIKGLIVRKVLVAEAVKIDREYYVGLLIDRRTKKPVIMVSPAGGIDIEEVARETPEKIFKSIIDPRFGLHSFQCLNLAMKLHDDLKKARVISRVMQAMYAVFTAIDASLVEINPLVLTVDGEIWAIDAKINVDDSGLSKHTDIEKLRDVEAELPQEIKARESNLSYVKLDGSVGCVVNGAGLAMATMDLIKHYGGEPANFLDIGGSSSPEKVLSALEIIFADPNVKVVLFNIFGGITRCDDVANGIVRALDELDEEPTLVIRLTGTNEDVGVRILEERGLAATSSMDEAVKKAVELAGKV